MVCTSNKWSKTKEETTAAAGKASLPGTHYKIAGHVSTALIEGRTSAPIFTRPQHKTEAGLYTSTAE